MLVVNKDVEEFLGIGSYRDSEVYEFYETLKILYDQNQIVLGDKRNRQNDLYISLQMLDNGDISIEKQADGKFLVGMPLWFYEGKQLGA